MCLFSPAPNRGQIFFRSLNGGYRNVWSCNTVNSQFNVSDARARWSVRLTKGGEGVAGVECDVRRSSWSRGAEGDGWCGVRCLAATSGRCAIDASRRCAFTPRHSLAAYFIRFRHKHSIAIRLSSISFFYFQYPVHTKRSFESDFIEITQFAIWQ